MTFAMQSTGLSKVFKSFAAVLKSLTAFGKPSAFILSCTRTKHSFVVSSLCTAIKARSTAGWEELDGY